MNVPVKQYFQLLARYLRPQWLRVSLLALAVVGNIGLTLWKPQIIGRFIDTVLAGGAVNAVTQFGLLYLVVTLSDQAALLAGTYLTEDVKWRATNWLRLDLSDHCLRLDMQFHNDNTPGTMIERIDGDVTELSNFFSQLVLRVGANAILLTGTLVMLWLTDWRFGVAFAVYSALLLTVLLRTVGYGVPFWKARREATEKLFGFIEEVLATTEDVRASGAVAYVLQQLRRLITDLFYATRRAFMAGEVTWSTVRLGFRIGDAVTFGIGGILFLRGEVTLGTVFLVWQYNGYLRRPLEQLAHELRDLQSATAAIVRIEELFAQSSAIVDPPAPLALPDGPLAVELDHLSFGYEADDPILRDVSLALAPGQVLGLLGRTGSGKSTITRLLFRLYDPTAGAVRLGGHDLRAVAVDDIRSRVGVVTQQVQLFEATVRDNLTFFDRTVGDDRIIEALALLGLDDWYQSLEHGLDTLLRSGGNGLSAGEAQLLAFTRVFLKDPGLVILDEASSRLDPLTEQLIEHAVDVLLHNRSAIIVAHRLATVQRADDILILHDGQVREFGSRVALAANPDSHFAELLRTGLEDGADAHAPGQHDADEQPGFSAMPLAAD